jgi:hypothetical protein
MSHNYDIFRECVSESIVRRSEEKPTKTCRRRVQRAKRDPANEVLPERAAPEELADFIEVSFLRRLSLYSYIATKFTSVYSLGNIRLATV